MEKLLIVKNLEELKNLAKVIADNSFGGMFIGLIGDLGAGKTQFTKFFVKYLGGSEDDVVSPTFTILNEYFTDKFKIYHFDLYRLNSIEELEEIGYKDFFYDKKAITVVEWVNKIPECIPDTKILINFSFMKESENWRKIEIKFSGAEKWHSLFKNLVELQ